jgi:preprotein translocase subunit YajC
MTNLKLTFEHPWLLLLLIPVILMTLIPYFRMNKKYRKTRNRISSMVLHIIVSTLCILIFSGLQITYDIPNTESEVLLVVDTSFSGQENETQKNAFVESVINSTDSRFRLGVVTFGYDQVYAVELTSRMDGVYEQYLRSRRPNQNYEASDIASALEYASTLFTNPQSARIVLISDGVETDNAAQKVIRAIAAEGIKVDTVHFPNAEAENEIQLLGVATPKQSIRIGEKFMLELTLQSKFEQTRSVEIQLFDNDQESTRKVVDLMDGIQTVQVETMFAVPGMHKLAFEITQPGDDTSNLNNTLNSYMHLEVFDKILVIENIEGEASHLKTMLQDAMQVTVINIRDEQAMPKSVDDLRAYDEVILCNIANRDMPEGFDQILHTYVHSIGGG